MLGHRGPRASWVLKVDSRGDGARTLNTERADRELRLLAAFVEALPEIAHQWDEIGEGERASLALDWTDYLRRLDALEAARRAGELTSGQADTYDGLGAAVREALPLLRRVGFGSPTIALD